MGGIPHFVFMDAEAHPLASAVGQLPLQVLEGVVGGKGDAVGQLPLQVLEGVVGGEGDAVGQLPLQVLEGVVGGEGDAVGQLCLLWQAQKVGWPGLGNIGGMGNPVHSIQCGESRCNHHALPSQATLQRWRRAGTCRMHGRGARFRR